MENRFKPPKPFFKYLKSEYTCSRYGNGNIPLSDESQSNLLCAAYGVTAWIRSKQGADWCFKICGIEEVEPHYGFTYYYVPPHGDKRRISEDHGLRIFRRTKMTPVEILKSSIDIATRVVYVEGWKVPQEDMIKAAVSAYRSWIQTETGFSWIKSVFKPIMQVDVHNGISYRCTSVSGEVYWIGDDNIEADPNQSSMCINCDMTYPCTTNLKGIGDLCNRCYGENFGEMDVLILCNRHECANICCENYISELKLEDMLFEKYGTIS